MNTFRVFIVFVSSLILGLTLVLNAMAESSATQASPDQASATTPPAPESKSSALPMQIIKETVSSLIKINSEFEGEAKTTERRAKLRVLINPHFDFEEMARRSLGTYWNKITPEEQKEFIDVFSNLLAKTYLARIDTVTTNVVQFNTEKIDPPNALVKTTIEHKGDNFPIDYKMLNEDGVWRVYDVVIENIGLVANYRNEFAGIIRKEQFAGLMKRLKSKGDA